MNKDVKNSSFEIEKMSAEDIKNMASELTGEEIDDIENLFDSYIFYRTLKSGGKECFCTNCKEHYIFELKRIYTAEDVDFLNSKHNESVFCPKCGCPSVLKNIGRVKTGKNLYSQLRVVMVEVKDFNTVLLKCYYATKTYAPKWYYKNEVSRFMSYAEIQLSAVYLLTPGKSVKARLDGWYYGCPEWRIYKTHGEPFNAMFGGDRSYSFLGAEKLENSFLKYALKNKPLNVGANIEPNNVNAFHSNSACSFLSYFAELPAMEVLIKLGWTKPVNDVVFCHDLNKSLINWHSLKPWDIFKIDKVTYKDFERLVLNGKVQNDYKYILKVYKTLNKYAVSGMKSAYELADRFSYYDRFSTIIPLLKIGYSPTHILNYLKKQNKICNITGYKYGIATEYVDYISMAQELGYDLRQEVVAFPKNVIKAHDKASKLCSAIKYAEKEKKAKNILKKYIKKYEYSNDEYSIIVPQTVYEIVEEGQRQKHCVGGYADRHFDGKLCICFLRKNSDINSCFFTIEMRENNLIQIQGKQNKVSIKTEPAAEAFVNEWLEWVKNGSKKQKKADTSAA